MRIAVLSGKGGTGKTLVSVNLDCAAEKAVYADCDVDAPNLHLVMPWLSEPTRKDYQGFGKATIDQAKCIRCGFCEENCAFGALKDFSVSEFECEGCGVCVQIYPVQAISTRDHVSGQLMLYRNGETIFSTAQLKMGSGASGKLVTAVKRQLTQEAINADLAIIDGSPGIGCPVIASISGVDFVLIVAEPTVSGMHDMKELSKCQNAFGLLAPYVSTSSTSTPTLQTRSNAFAKALLFQFLAGSRLMKLSSKRLIIAKA